MNTTTNQPASEAQSQALSQCEDFRADTLALAQGQLTVMQFCQRAQARTALRQALPDTFDQVLTGLLDRLESAALFTEESCSFSQRDLIDNLRLWQDKAQARLSR